VNNGVKNPLGQPTAYAIVPGENAPSFQSAASAPRRRAPFLNHHLWVTRHAPSQMYASGEWVSIPGLDEGVASWSADDESLVDQDVVVWYTHSVVHLPRPEDWPIMPSYTAGFRLVPVGFFGSNPTLER
jgi:primary-amine oxidase